MVAQASNQQGAHMSSLSSRPKDKLYGSDSLMNPEQGNGIAPDCYLNREQVQIALRL